MNFGRDCSILASLDTALKSAVEDCVEGQTSDGKYFATGFLNFVCVYSVTKENDEPEIRTNCKKFGLILDRNNYSNLFQFI